MREVEGERAKKGGERESMRVLGEQCWCP